MKLDERLRTLRDVAAVVREPLRLAFERMRGKSTTGRYHLRRSGLVVHLRHDVLDDVATLVQTFRQGHYVLPDEARAALDALGRPIRVMDLGANVGMFGAWLLSDHPDAHVIGYEADPANARVHALTVDANRNTVAWELVAAAAGARDGTVRFAAGGTTNSRLAGDDEPGGIAVPQHDVLARANAVDLLKIDIEGAEWALLEDPRFARLATPVVALEYHAERCPEDDPAGAATRALERAGYRVRPGDLDAEPGHGMVWGWRTA